MESTRRTQVALLLLLIVMVLGSKVEPIDGLTISSSPGRSLLQTDNDTTSIGQLDDDTVRVDPLNKFRRYRGGFNVTNKHYWTSTMFTGVYGYSIGVLWLFSGVLYGCFVVATTLCCKKRKLKRSSVGYKQSHMWFVLQATFFILAIVASGLVITGNAKFHSEAKSVVNIIIKTTNEASETILNTTAAMRGMRNNLEASNRRTEASLLLASTSDRLITGATDIEIQARKHGRFIDKGLEILYITTSVTISFSLIAAIALAGIGIMRLPWELNLLIVLCWFLTFLCWFFFGVYFFLERFSTDTCTALEGFKENPNNNSLSSILPCNELLSAKPLLLQVRSGIYNLFNEVKATLPLQATFMSSVARVCNPFSAPPECQYKPENCPPNSIHIGDIPKALKNLACSDANNGACGFISTREFKRVEAFASSIQELMNVYPGIEGLVQCQPVKDAFTEIITKHCKPSKRHVRLVWAGMVLLSVDMVVLILTWIAKAQHENQHQLSD